MGVPLLLLSVAMFGGVVYFAYTRKGAQKVPWPRIGDVDRGRGPKRSGHQAWEEGKEEPGRAALFLVFGFGILS